MRLLISLLSLCLLFACDPKIRPLQPLHQPSMKESVFIKMPQFIQAGVIMNLKLMGRLCLSE